MPPSCPIALRLPGAYARGRVSLGALFLRIGVSDAGRQQTIWRLSSREWSFAQEVLFRHTRLWLYRTDPKARAGDFVVVDMSCPRPEGRVVWVVDLKCLAPLKIGGGGAGVSLMHADRAIAFLEDHGIVRDCRPILATGDGQTLHRLWTSPTGPCGSGRSDAASDPPRAP